MIGKCLYGCGSNHQVFSLLFWNPLSSDDEQHKLELPVVCDFRVLPIMLITQMQSERVNMDIPYLYHQRPGNPCVLTADSPVFVFASMILLISETHNCQNDNNNPEIPTTNQGATIRLDLGKHVQPTESEGQEERQQC